MAQKVEPMHFQPPEIAQGQTGRDDDFDAVVVGGGPAGLAAALALDHAGAKTALAGPPHQPAGDRLDMRTAALFPGSIAMLANLGVWEKLRPVASSLTTIRLIDDRDALFRAPEVTFHSDEIGRASFGFNVPNTPLVDALRARDRFLTIWQQDEMHIVQRQTEGVHVRPGVSARGG